MSDEPKVRVELPEGSSQSAEPITYSHADWQAFMELLAAAKTRKLKNIDAAVKKLTELGL